MARYFCPFIDTEAGYPGPFTDVDVGNAGQFIDTEKTSYPGPFTDLETGYSDSNDAEVEYSDLLMFCMSFLNISV
jgi:hypothetical protein